MLKYISIFIFLNCFSHDLQKPMLPSRCFVDYLREDKKELQLMGLLGLGVSGLLVASFYSKVSFLNNRFSQYVFTGGTVAYFLTAPILIFQDYNKFKTENYDYHVDKAVLDDTKIYCHVLSESRKDLKNLFFKANRKDKFNEFSYVSIKTVMEINTLLSKHNLTCDDNFCT
jgi:hypothetical protein